MSDFDAIIIGTGAAGNIVAGLLCEAGKRVLLLERGKMLSDSDLGRDHLRNQRLALYNHNSGPDREGNPRVFINPKGERHTIAPHQWEYMNNAATVGGGTRVYGGQAWRFHPKDFRMATEYGVPEGSSLADWPLTYDDLEPFYERAEWEVGVSGADDGNITRIPRKRGLPDAARCAQSSNYCAKAGGGRSRLGHVCGSTRHQYHALSWASCLYRMFLLCGICVSGGCKEWEPQHVPATRSGDRTVRTRH